MIKINKKSFVNQTSSNDCGLACLTMILKLNGINISLDEIKNKTKIYNEQASVYDIIKFSKKCGVDAVGYKKVSLKNIKVPCIAHIVNEDNTQHFVVILKIFKDRVLIADPAKDILYIDKKDFVKKYTGVVIYFNKKENILNEIIKNKWHIVKIIILTFSLTIVSSLFSFMIPIVISLLNKNYAIYNIITIILFFLIISLFKDILMYIKYRSTLKFQINTDKAITRPVLKKIINLPHEFYHFKSAGELITKVNDLSYIKDIIFSFVEVIIINIFLIIFSFMLIAFINYKIILLDILFLIILYFINKCFLRNNLSKSYELQELNEKLNSKLTNIFNSILLIKNLNKESYFINKITNIHNDLLNKNEKLNLAYQKKELISSFIISIFNISYLIILLLNSIDISKLLVIVSFQEIIISSSNEIYKLLPLYSNYKSTYLRLNAIYNQKELEPSDEVIDIKSIKIKNIKFKYKDKLVLNNICFDINKGDWIMINGPTGSGKSTLFKLITKQIKYKGKGIFINNKNINDYDEVAIRNSILYVDQKIKVLNESIKENIFMGDFYDEVVLKTSLVDKMLIENNIDYDYLIDNTNSNLSGGQISKIAIAQALNKKSDIIIFDETTSNLDEKTEKIILENIKNNYKDKTIILISHRKSNVNLFNKVLNFNNGRLIK